MSMQRADEFSYRLQATYTWTKERLLWTTQREYWFKGMPVGR